MMWVEARKQERKIRGMIVDFRKRAERRKDFYEKFTQDPSQFLQLHGRPCKMHLQPLSNAGSAGEHGPGMMPWPGDSSVIIDRFDGRAHLDFIAEKRSKEDDNYDHDLSSTALAHVNYERYRILVQNDFLNLPEDKYLQQIYMEEKFGPVMKTGEEEKKKQLSDKKAAIPYTYEDSTTPAATAKEDEEEEDADSDVDLDLSINVVELNRDQCTEMNDFAHKYSIKGNDFVSFMYDDHHEQEALRKAKQEEEEKQALSGKKGRRERRQFREKRMLALARKYSPPSYATRNSPTYDPYEKPKDGRSKKKSKSASRSPSPKMTKVTYITSFGGESDSDDNAVKGGPKGIFIPITARRHSSGDRAPPASSLGASVLAAVADVRRGRRSRSGSRKRGRDSRGRRNSRTRGSRSRSRRRKFTEKKRKSRSSSREKKRRSSSSSREKKRRSRSSSREKKRRGRRSASSSSRSRSRSRSKSTARKISREKKPAVTATVNVGQVPKLPSPPRRRYYGRRAHASSDASDSSDESSSERGRTDDGKPAVARIPLGAVASLLASSSTSKDGKTTSPGRSSGQTGGAKSRGSDDTRIHASATSGGSTKTSAGGKLTPQERLKRKMQALINRQYKADKLAELEKREKKLQEEADREDEMRDLTIKYRRKERERRNRDREDMGLPPLLSDDTDDEEYADRFLADMGPDKDAKDVREYFRRRSRSRSRSGSRSSTKRRSTTASKWTKSSVKRRARSTSSSSSSSSSSQSSLFTRRSRRSRSKSRSRSTSNKRRRRDARRPRSSSSSGSERRNRKRRNNNQNDGKRKKSPSPGPKTTSSAKRQSNTSVYFDEKNYGYGQDEPSSWNEPPPPGDHWGGGHPPPPPPPGWNHNDSWNNDWHGPHPPPYPPPMHHPPPSYPPPPPPPHMPPPSGNWSDKGIERGNRRFTTPPPGLEDEGSDGSSSDTGNTRLVNY